eukprot:Seg1675.11 transcript_id=Seg1675.11/GoldUCD/mRNA.D3Y31 product="CTTNBP2 N-terminal-like protein" protein_id=Seg1675.11/GoldUCD/D3Y31
MMSEEAARFSPNHVAGHGKKVDRTPSVKGRPRHSSVSKNFQGLQKDDLVNLLCVLEAEVQARDVIISSILRGEIGSSLPLSHLLGDSQHANIVKVQEIPTNEEDEEVWLGEPTAHLNHVVAYHQLVREQMQAMLQDQHKTILRQLEDERQIHAIDTAQGDQVTYMLEKDRERLTNEIEFQQTKLSKAEKERDKYMLILEREREEKQNEFNLLVNDCKMFAKQLIEQALREEQLQKEIEQEKRKNRVLSELMVEEQKRFKEKLKLVDEERTENDVIDREKIELEERLIESEKRSKEAHQRYIQETHLVKKLQLEVKQLRLLCTSEDSFESTENSDELVYDEPIPALGETARIVQPNKVIVDDKIRSKVVDDEPEQFARVIEEQKFGAKTASHVKIAKGTASPQQIRSGNQGTVARRPQASSQTTPTKVAVNQKTPTKEPHGVNQISHGTKQASPAKAPHGVNQSSSPQLPHGKNVNATTKHPHSPVTHSKLPHGTSPTASPKLPRTVNQIRSPQMTHTVNDDAKNKKVPPPTPPRVSSITAKSVPVLPSDVDSNFDLNSGNFIRSHSVGAASVEAVGKYERRQTMGGSPGRLSLLVVVATGYGWEYTNDDGLIQSNSVNDILGEMTLFPDSDWPTITENAKKMFLEKAPARMSKDLDVNGPGLSRNSILRFELGTIAWTATGFPSGITPWSEASGNEDGEKMLLKVRLGDETATSFDSVAFSTAVPIGSLQEYCRLIKKYRNILFLTDDELEAKHFISCFSNWLKIIDITKGKTNFVASVEENEICSPQELTRVLVDNGAMVIGQREKPTISTIVLIDVDFVISRRFSSDIFSWLGKRGMEESFYLANGCGINSQLHYLQSNVIVLAYATRSSLNHISQGMHRYFKIIDLPSTMPYLLQRWLRQKATKSSETNLSLRELDNWISWISDVYKRTRVDLEKLDIKLDMPDIGLFLSAPIDELKSLRSWAESLWLNHFQPQVESSVEEQVAEASNNQQELLIQVALKAFLEGAFLPGCPCRLEV